MLTRGKAGIFKPKTFQATILPNTSLPDSEPTTYSFASKNAYWRHAMDDKFKTLTDQKTWVLVPKPHGRHPVGCKWVYKIKHNADGSIFSYKARLVANGYNQEYGLDYSETFSPVIRQETIRLVLSLAVHNNAFLHGMLDETIYMTQPPGYVDPRFPQHVCKL